MMAAEATPRVNFELLQQHVNKRVLLVAQIDSVEGGKARVKAADGGMVSVELRNTNTAFETPFVEFRGVVTSPSSLREESHVNFGSTFELGTYNELCKIAAQDHAEIFA